MTYKNPPIPKNEVSRLDALASYNILDTLPEKEFDRLTQLASIICGAPIAIITLIDKDRQWFKSKIGLNASEMPRDISFCQYTINDESLLEIEDARKDELFLSSPLVTAQPNVRFYAGCPLTDPDGYAIGSLCVMDFEVRKLTAAQRHSLTLLANEVVSQIVFRKKNAEKEKLEKLLNLSTDMICVAGTDGYFKKLNAAFTFTLGWTIEELLAKPFYDFIHPDDVTITINEIKKLATGEKTINFENRFITKNGDCLSLSWVANTDEITGELYAVARDINERKKAEEVLTEYKHFFYNTASFSCIANVQGYFEVINPNFEKILGYTKRELLENPFLSFIHPEDIDLTLKEIEKLKNGDITINFENRYRKKDGNYLHLDWNTTPNPVTGKLYAVARDITERKKIEKSLEKSFSNIEAILEATADGILVVDPLGNIISYNEKFRELWDLTKMVLNNNPKKLRIDLILHKLVHPEIFILKLAQLFENPEATSTDIIKLKDDRVIERYSKPMFINGVHSGHVMSFRNITNRISTEKELEDYKFALDEASLVSVTDVNGIILHVNENFCSMSKYSREELIGQDHGIVNSDYHTKSFMKNLWETVTNGKVWREEAKIKAKDDSNFWADTTIVPFLNPEGKPFKYMVIGSNITKRKNAEEKILQVFERYDILSRATSDTIWDWNMIKDEMLYNEGITEIFGYKADDIDYAADWWKKNIHTADHPTVFASIDEACDNKTKTIQMEYRYRCADGSYKHIHDRAFIMYDKTGKPVRMIGAMQDITEKKNLAIEVSKAKESFLVNMSHEIRTPLNAIIGFLRAFEKQELSDLQKTYIDNSLIASKHLLAILNDILDLSKIEAEEMSLDLEDFIIEDTVNNVLKVLDLKAKQKEISLTSLISDKVNKVFKGDSLRLEQILFNLIGNALKFTEKGEINVNCELISDSNTSQIIRISVADTGIGMEQKYAESIFSKFSQEDNSITREYGGTGLGMPITKELVHLMGGEIEIESEKYNGTTINVKINLKKGNIKNVKKIQAKVDFNLKGLSILLVEDNEMNRMVVQIALQYYNCNVTEVENGFEALEILKTRKFDLILMDMQMPGMDGIEATKVIRKKLKLSTPIIALTANAFKTEIKKCKQAGMNDYVTKPFEKAVLLQTIVKHTINKKGIPSLDNEMNPNQPLYNLNVLHNSSGGNDEFVLEMVGVFVKQTISTIEKIDAALEANNFPEISRLIHKIRPSTGNMGVLSIQSKMKTLEKIAKETQNKQKITAIYRLVKKTLQHVISQLQKNELNV